MDREILKELGYETEDLSDVGYVQQALDIYYETLLAMGMVPFQPTSRTVSSCSQVGYKMPLEPGDEYADIPEYY